MKRLSKLLLLGAMAVGIGLTACSKGASSDTPTPQSEGNTHISISLRLGSGTAATPRALPNDYNDVGNWAGKDQIKTITVFVSDATEVMVKEFSVGAGEAYEMVGNVVTPKLTTAAIRTTPGWKEVYVLINATDQLKTFLGVTLGSDKIASAANFKAMYESALKLENKINATTSPYTVETSASKLASVETEGNEQKDVITMTNLSSKTINVAPNIKDTETIAGTNRVSLEVDRAVARVVVTQAHDTYDVPTASGGSVLGTISNVTWVLAQGENRLYVQRKEDYKTPSYDWVATPSNFITEAADRYDYSGLYEAYDPATKMGGTPVPNTSLSGADVIGVGSIKDGKFILANTHEAATGDASKYKKGNTAYVMVRAKFTPTTFADSDPAEADGSFYLGANGKFYHTSAAAVDPSKGGVVGQTVAKYDGGKVIYYAWVNPDKATPGEWFNSPVIRNNIYHIHITGFKSIGTNWNPLFPEDPDSPKTPEEGGNPDPKPNVPGVEEPENPNKPDEPLTTPETYMSVDVTVRPWLVHSYSIDL